MPKYEAEATLKAEVGSYGTQRLNGMVNVPLADNFAIRGAGAMTKREGFDYNSFTNRHVNDRDLWSTRLSAQWEPNDDLKANFVWQHFEENDRRSRSEEHTSELQSLM